MLLACAVLLGVPSVPSTRASHGETVFFEAPAELLRPSTRPHALAQLQALGGRGRALEVRVRPGGSVCLGRVSVALDLFAGVVRPAAPAQVRPRR